MILQKTSHKHPSTYINSLTNHQLQGLTPRGGQDVGPAPQELFDHGLSHGAPSHPFVRGFVNVSHHPTTKGIFHLQRFEGDVKPKSPRVGTFMDIYQPLLMDDLDLVLKPMVGIPHGKASRWWMEMVNIQMIQNCCSIGSVRKTLRRTLAAGTLQILQQTPEMVPLTD